MSWLVVVLALISNSTYEFRFELPDDYVQGDKPSGNGIYVFERGNPSKPPYARLAVDSLGVRIDQSKHDATKGADVGTRLPDGSTVSSRRARKVTWNGFALDALTGTLQGERPYGFGSVVIPLASAAIQVTIVSTASEDEVYTELGKIVQSLQGRTDWVLPVDEVEEHNFGTYAAIGLGGLAALFVGIHFLMRRK